MLGTNLNGLRFPTTPPPTSGRYPFRVMERYYGKGKGGSDLTVMYTYWLPQTEVKFNPFDFAGETGVVLNVKTTAFEKLESSIRQKGADDFAIYPGFGELK